MCVLAAVVNDHGVWLLSMRQVGENSSVETSMSLLETLSIGGQIYTFDNGEKSHYGAIDQGGWWVSSIITVPNSMSDKLSNLFSMSVVQNGATLLNLPSAAQKTTRWALPIMSALYADQLTNMLWKTVFDGFFLHKFDIKVSPSKAIGLRHTSIQPFSSASTYGLQIEQTKRMPISLLKWARVFMSHTLWLLENYRIKEIETVLWGIQENGWPEMVENIEAVMRGYGLLGRYSTEPIGWNAVFGPMSYTALWVGRNWYNTIYKKLS